jgi:hypothetical protein
MFHSYVSLPAGKQSSNDKFSHRYKPIPHLCCAPQEFSETSNLALGFLERMLRGIFFLKWEKSKRGRPWFLSIKMELNWVFL